MANPSTQLSSVETLIAQSEALRRFDGIIYRFDRLLSPPSVPMLLHGLRRMRRLQEVLAWPLPVLDDLTQDELEELIRAMAAVPGMQVAQMDASGLKDAYPVWASLAEHEPKADAHTCLHGLLVLVAGCCDQKSLVRNLASAIRGAGRKPSGAEESLESILDDVPYSQEPEQFFGLLVDLRHRIAQAKPAFHQILVSEIPQLLGWPVPEHEPDPEGLDWEPPMPVPLPAAEAIEPWEPEDEIQPPDTYLPAPINRNRLVSSLRSALISLRQRIHGGNPLLVPEHISSLRKEEARCLADWLYGYIVRSAGDTDPRKLTGAAVLATMLATGRTADRAAVILETVLASKPGPGRPAINLESGQLVQPVLIPESAYAADDQSRENLLQTSQTMRLTLPPRFIEMVKAWKHRASEIRPFAHWKSIYAVLGDIRATTSMDFTEGRVRHTLSCHTCEVSRDPVQSIWITCNDARHSLAPTHYTVLDHSELDNTYTKAVWPIFQGDEAPPKSATKGLLGAQTCPQDRFIKEGLKKLAARVHNPARRRGGAESLAQIHNNLVDHITVMLVVLTGHRPNTAIHHLKRWDFDLQLGVAIYRDKQSDPAHFYCPVALGKILTEQLVVYEHHLVALRRHLREQAAPHKTLDDLDNALSGDAPWFFHLDDGLQPKTPSFEAWRGLLSACFPDVPPNVGRSYLARKLRTEEGSRPEFAYLQLGHYAIIGYPYIADGPTSIVEMARSLGPVMDRIVASSLGRIRKLNGLYRGSRMPAPLEMSAPCIGIRSWAGERQAAEQAALAHKQRLREQRKKRDKELRAEAEARFFRRMTRIHPAFSAALKVHLHDQRLPEPGRKFTLKPEDFASLLADSSGEPTGSEKELPAAKVIALRNFTHYALSKARASRYYRGSLPRAEIRLPSRFRTEFFPNMLAAAETMRRLRGGFFGSVTRELPQKAAAEGVTEEEWGWAYLAAVLVLFGGVTHLSRLLGMLSSACQVARHPRSDDAVLVQYSTEPPHVWALWRAAAIAYMQMREGLPERAPEAVRLSRALEYLLPSDLQRHQETDLLTCLLETARVAELTQLSGMARASTNPETGSWSLPLQRQVAWLSNTDDESRPPEGLASNSGVPKVGLLPKAIEVKEVYDKLLPLIPRTNKDVLDEDGNLKIPHETHRRYRQAVIDGVRDVIAMPHTPELATALGDWLQQMLRMKKAEGVYAFAESTIYNYFTTVASGLLSVLPQRVTMDLDDDEYIDLYSDLLERKPEKTRKTTARELRNFHSLLIRSYGAPELDWSELADYLVDVPDRVDAQVVLSREAEHALNTLRSWAFAGTTNEHVDRRLMRQSYIVLLLLLLTGCRLSEIAGLQHRDIYQLFERIYIRIRPNYGRGTKSDAAKRILDLTDVITEAETRLLLRWKDAEKRRLGKKWKMTTRLLLDLETDRAVDRDLLRNYTQVALRYSSPWPLISHHIRHGLGGRMQLDFGLSQTSAMHATRMDDPVNYEYLDNRPLLLPRDVTRYRVRIGHATNCTVNRSYGHCPWVYLHGPALQWNESLPSNHIAAAMDLSQEAYRQHKLRHGKTMWSRLLDRSLKPTNRSLHHKQRQLPDPPAVPTSGLPPAACYLIACAPGVIKSEKGADESDYEAYGLDFETVSKLRRSAEDVAQATGIAFLPRHAERGRRRSSMVPVTSDYAGSVLALLDCLRHDPDTAEVITATYLAAANPNRRQDIVLPRRQAYELHSLTQRYCPALKLKVSNDATGYQCKLVDPNGNDLNHWLSWTLALMAVLMPEIASEK